MQCKWSGAVALQALCLSVIGQAQCRHVVDGFASWVTFSLGMAWQGLTSSP